MTWDFLNPLFWYEDWKRSKDAQAQERRRAIPTVRLERESVEEARESLYKDTSIAGKNGYVRDAVAGTGATITLDIDNGSFKRSWLFINCWKELTASPYTPKDVDERQWFYASNNAIGTEPIAGWNGVNNGIVPFPFRVPTRYARQVILLSDNTYTYYLCGIWEEDR